MFDFDEELMLLLSDGVDIPWSSRAEQFVICKTASVGPSPEEVEGFVQFIKMAADGAEEGPSPVQLAIYRKVLNALSNQPAADIARVGAYERTRGEHIGKELGTIAGVTAGLLAGKKHGIPAQALGAATGALMGRGVGKEIGSTVDYRRALQRLQMQKEGAASQEPKRSSHKALLLGGAIGAGAGATAGLLEPTIQTAWEMRRVKKLNPQMSKEYLKRLKSMYKAVYFPSKRVAARTTGAAVGGALLGTTTAAVTRLVRNYLKKRKQSSIEKRSFVEEPALAVDPLEQFLITQQKANEAEYFRQEAEAAKAEAEAARQQQMVAQQENEEMQQQLMQAEEQLQQQQQVDQQEKAMLQQQAAQAAQESVMAQEQAMHSQQAMTALRAAIANYRKALMSIVAQDPTETLFAQPPNMATEEDISGAIRRRR